MAIASTRPETVQFPRVAMQRVTQAELPTGAVVPVIKVPPGAIVTGGGFKVTTAFNSATTDTIDVGDTGGADTLLNGGDDNGSTTGWYPLVPNGTQYTAGGWITVENTAAGTEGTAGEGYLVVEYIVEGRFNEIQPTGTVPDDA